jgi:hypothetical protein
MVKAGDYNRLKVLRKASSGVYLDDGDKGILLPNRYVPADIKEGDEIDVFIYHDSEDRIIATTEKPLGKVGDMIMLEAVSVTPQGAFLNWGLLKDLFVPKSRQLTVMRPGGRYLVMIYVDEQTGRVAATEKINPFLSNDTLTIKELEEVDLTVLRRTDIGYLMIINNRHTGVLHFNEIYRSINPGDRFRGYVKKIHEGNKVDVVAGKPGFARVEDEQTRILRLLKENGGYLPYYDKSDPDVIYDFFGMSKKTFKMAIGGLYRQRKISMEKTGIKLL